MVTEEKAKGSAIARVKVTAEHLNPHGSVHGAVLFAMVDTAMGAARNLLADLVARHGQVGANDHWGSTH